MPGGTYVTGVIHGLHVLVTVRLHAIFRQGLPFGDPSSNECTAELHLGQPSRIVVLKTFLGG